MAYNSRYFTKIDVEYDCIYEDSGLSESTINGFVRSCKGVIQDVRGVIMIACDDSGDYTVWYEVNARGISRTNVIDAGVNNVVAVAMYRSEGDANDAMDRIAWSGRGSTWIQVGHDLTNLSDIAWKLKPEWE